MRARRAGAARAGEVFASHPSRSCPSHLRPSHPSESLVRVDFGSLSSESTVSESSESPASESRARVAGDLARDGAVHGEDHGGVEPRLQHVPLCPRVPSESAHPSLRAGHPRPRRPELWGPVPLRRPGTRMPTSESRKGRWGPTCSAGSAHCPAAQRRPSQPVRVGSPGRPIHPSRPAAVAHDFNRPSRARHI